MIDSLVCAEVALCWALANYALNSGPVAHPSGADRQRSGFARQMLPILLRCSIPAIALALSIRPWRMSLWMAIAVLATSASVCWICEYRVAIRHLVELELLSNLGVGLALWLFLAHAGSFAAVPLLASLAGPWPSVVCICGAALLFTVEGGNFMVRGILEKAGGMPAPDDTSTESVESFRHGRFIGQVERIIVLIIVVAGNLSALAFFFAAKGLIRSKELEKRSSADYFLLGSLVSFLVALAAGLFLRRVLAALCPAGFSLSH